MIAKLSANSAENYYYEKDPVFNAEGENNNLNWSGKGADKLSLSGTVEKEDFKSLLEGKTKEGQVLRNASQKTSGEDRKAFDITLSAPKSVSHLGLVMDKKEVIEAHHKAVNDTLAFAEKNYAQARVYNAEGERVKETTENLVVAQAKHSVSRPTKNAVSDPSLHTHNVIMNTTQTRNGSWKSLNTDLLFKNQSTINQMYKENLAHNLKEAGYSLNYDKKGGFEIAGYTQDVLDNFSKRKFEIKAQAEEMKKDEKFARKTDKELRDYAQHNSKSDKSDITKEELKKNWNQQHKEAGITSKEELMSNIDRERDFASTQEKLSVKDVVKIASENLTDKESHFDKNTLMREALKVNQGDNKVSDIEKFIDDTKKIGQKEPSDLKKIEVGGETRFTTKEIYDIEKENRKLLSKAKSTSGLLTEKQANKGLDSYEKKMGWKMTETQRLAAFTALTTADKYSSVQGDAGTGKTTFLDAVRHSLEHSNKNSQDLGVLAPTGKASAGAQAESGIEAKTVDSYLLKGFDAKESKDSEMTSGSKTRAISKINDKEVFDKKFQLGGGFLGVGFSKNGISTISKNRSYDKHTKSFKETKVEKIKTGQYKGSIKKSEFSVKGDTFINKSSTKLNDGRELKTESREWNPTKSAKLNLVSNKSFSKLEKDAQGAKEFGVKQSSLLGFTRKTTTNKLYDKDGKILESSAKSEISFMGKTLTKASKVDDKNIVNGNSVSKNSSSKIEGRVETKKNDSTVKDIDKQLDKSIQAEASDKKMLFVDESSMMSSKKLNSLLKDAEEKGHKIMLIGDSKQLQSVQQGRSFNEVQELTKSTHMNEGMRQRSADADTKKVVDSFAQKDVKTALETLDKQDKFKEMNETQRVDYISDKLSKDSGFKNTIALASTRDEVSKINDSTREKIFGDKNFGTKFKVLEDKSLDSVKKMSASNFEKGDKISMKVESSSGKERFSTYEVKAVNQERNQLLVGSDKKTFTINLRKDSEKITTVEKEVEKSFTKGDKVMNLKNDSKKGVMNGEIGYVSKISGNKMTVDFGKKSVEYDMSKAQNLNHSYAMSIHKSQGVTEQKAIATFDTKNAQMNNQNLAYVASSRHKTEYELLTNDKTKLTEQVSQEQNKTSTSDSKEAKEEMYKESEFGNEKSSDKYKETGFEATKDDEKSQANIKEKEINKSSEKDVELSK